MNDGKQGHAIKINVTHPAQNPVTREELASKIDPAAFDDTLKKSTRYVAVVQWGVRRKWAFDAADKILADFTVLHPALVAVAPTSKLLALDPEPWQCAEGICRAPRKSMHENTFYPRRGYSMDLVRYPSKETNNDG